MKESTKLKIINSFLFAWYRKKFLGGMYKWVEEREKEGRNGCCCHYQNRFFKDVLGLCWKDLKEIKNNVNSEYISSVFVDREQSDCGYAWFETNKKRLLFLQECIDSFNNKKIKI